MQNGQEVSKTCRTCLEKHGELLSMYNGDDNRIVEMLEYILDTQLEFTDGLPQKVCHKCFEDISRCYLFKTKCNNSFKTLKTLLDKRKNTLEINNMQIKLEPELNITDQFLEIGETTEPYNQLTTMQPPANTGEISIKMEPLDIVSASYNDSDNSNHWRQLRRSQMQTPQVASPSTIVSDNNDSDHFQEDKNIADNHTVQYLIKELNEEQNSTDQLLEVEVNIRHCASCGAGFAEDRDFNNHLKKCRQINPIQNRKNKHQCPYCDKAFPRPCRLKNHVRKHREVYEANTLPESPPNPPKKQHICPECDSSFTLESSLIFHMSFHKKEKRFKHFSNEKFYNKNINLDANPKKYKCEDCGLAFEWTSQLKHHMLDHRGNHDFVCKLCPQKFIHADQFKAHSIQEHNDERPFKCKFCGVGFTNKYNVVYHQRKHVARLEESAHKNKVV